jgi:hypothetical protein
MIIPDSLYNCQISGHIMKEGAAQFSKGLEKPMDSVKVKLEPEDSSSCSWQSRAGPYPDLSSPHLPTISNIHFNIILTSHMHDI